MPSSRAVLRRIRCISNFTVAGIWLFQGIVPKLLGPHPDEIALSNAFGIAPELHVSVSYVAGVGELFLGACVLFAHRQVWPQAMSALVTAALLVFVAIYSPSHLIGAFNPVVMNSASMALSVISILALRGESADSGNSSFKQQPGGET